MRTDTARFAAIVTLEVVAYGLLFIAAIIAVLWVFDTIRDLFR